MSKTLFSLASDHQAGRHSGIASICSAHPLVIRAALARSERTERPVLIEATCNQVNQFGGYTGMVPQDFADFVYRIADEVDLPHNQILLGGDHLGPNPWRKEPAETAMEKAEAMVANYVRAGFSKLHLDASMGCAGEPAALDDETTARRAARLARVADSTARKNGLPLPLYIIGTEVPVPGGADHVLDTVEPTSPAAAQKTIDVHEAVFAEEGLGDAFQRVIAVVVQPGVEFGADNVIAYQPDKAAALSQVLKNNPYLVFEAHSTDYQSRAALRQLVADGYPILKVGPAVTFALREALYGLDLIASEIDPSRVTLRSVMEDLMVRKPGHWQGHYHGDETALRLQRHFSYSDRIRYYWTQSEAEAAVARLVSFFQWHTIPETLLHQYLPQIAGSRFDVKDPQSMILAAIDLVLEDYDTACLG